MNSLKLVSYIFVICFTLSCKEAKKGNIAKTSIEILYFKGEVNTRTSISCGDITKTESFFIKDTVLLDEQKYNEIVNQIKPLRELRIDNSTSNCDVRIQCKINLTNGDSITLCIGKFNCLIKNGQRMEASDPLVYLIRKYSGYYNYFSKEDLSYFDELKQFGIPNDYKDLRRINSPDSIPLPPQ